MQNRPSWAVQDTAWSAEGTTDPRDRDETMAGWSHAGLETRIVSCSEQLRLC